MIELMLYAFLIGFAFFLLGMSVFMYFENRKFEDNQHMVKLLPPPPRLAEAKAETEVRLTFAAEVSPVPIP